MIVNRRQARALGRSRRLGSFGSFGAFDTWCDQNYPVLPGDDTQNRLCKKCGVSAFGYCVSEDPPPWTVVGKAARGLMDLTDFKQLAQAAGIMEPDPPSAEQVLSGDDQSVVDRWCEGMKCLNPGQHLCTKKEDGHWQADPGYNDVDWMRRTEVAPTLQACANAKITTDAQGWAQGNVAPEKCECFGIKPPSNYITAWCTETVDQTHQADSVTDYCKRKGIVPYKAIRQFPWWGVGPGKSKIYFRTNGSWIISCGRNHAKVIAVGPAGTVPSVPGHYEDGAFVVDDPKWNSIDLCAAPNAFELVQSITDGKLVPPTGDEDLSSGKPPKPAQAGGLGSLAVMGIAGAAAALFLAIGKRKR